MNEGIAAVARITIAHCQMIGDVTLGVEAARAWARICALRIYASLSRRTIRIEKTLWSTALVGISHVIGDTGARTSAVLLFADRVRSAG